MTPVNPNLPKSGRYDIKATSSALEIHRNTLRRIPAKLLPVHRSLNGRPFYFGEDINTYWRRNKRY